MAEFVLIPGGWYGGWVFEGIERPLLARGHVVRSVTLSGLGAQPAPAANLSTHVADAVGVLKAADEPVVLCGHSYGGMVITGAADAVPEKVKALVYLDAYVPEDGDTTWSLTTARFRDMFIAGAAENGTACAPPPGIDPRCRPHPMARFFRPCGSPAHGRRSRVRLTLARTVGREARSSICSRAFSGIRNGQPCRFPAGTASRATHPSEPSTCYSTRPGRSAGEAAFTARP